MENHFQPKKSFSFKMPNIKGMSDIKLPKINFKWGLFFKITGILLLIIVLIAGIIGFIYGKPAYDIYLAAKDLNNSSYGLKQSLKTQDLEKIRLNLNTFENDYKEFKDIYSEKSPKLKTLPIVKNYIGDVDHLMTAADSTIKLGYLFLDTLEPYAEELGLKEGSKNLNNEQKIRRIANVLPKISDEVDEISALLVEIDKELQKIDSTKYPEEFRGVKIREQIVSMQTVFSELAIKSPQFKDLFEQLPTLIGTEKPVTYLVVMANATELRMGTGGFPTYAVVVEMNNGIPKIVKSVDTYSIDVDSYALDNRNVPDYMYSELYVNRLYARDAMNVYADFSDGADLFMNRYWNMHPGTGAAGLLPEVDGIVAVNTHLAEDLLEVLGPVDVRGRSFLTDQGTYKGFSDTEFDSENIIYNLEVIANSELSEIQGRKDIIKFLLESILNKVLNAKSENILPLAQTFLEALGSKDIIVYYFDPEVNQAMTKLNYAGSVRNVPNGSWDYLYINHNNYGGGKRNWIVNTETVKKVYKEGGKNVSELTIKVENPKAPEWWETSWLYTYKDYVLIYVPKGSKLINSTLNGEKIEPKKYSDVEDYGKEYFDYRVWVEEGNTATLNIKYQLPDTINLSNYKVLVQKQPGSHGDLYSVISNDTEKRFTLNSDMELDFGE